MVKSLSLYRCPLRAGHLIFIRQSRCDLQQQQQQQQQKQQTYLNTIQILANKI